jgi:hypothetical protein
MMGDHSRMQLVHTLAFACHRGLQALYRDDREAAEAYLRDAEEAQAQLLKSSVAVETRTSAERRATQLLGTLRARVHPQKFAN